ncbi:DUF2971 domain-containing protein [Leclercia adecarboxylata]|nr:DUF2971 domain-containing protein [Leclercia adecarboxylata]MBK0351061.1 DUF2971 domain-containing protein [Leclercia adecarboxylata]
MNNAIPSVLYKYKAFSINSLDSLINDTVYLADPITFNDPFDCKPSIQMDLTDLDKLREITAKLMLDTQIRELFALKSSVMRYIEHQQLTKSYSYRNLDKHDDQTFLKKFDQYRKDIRNEYVNFEAAQIEKLRIDIVNFLEHLEDSITPNMNHIAVEMYEDLISKELVVSRNIGVLSLAKENNCPLMWSHYSDDHQGFCCAYRLPSDPNNFASDKKLKPVDYDGVRCVSTSQLYKLANDSANVKSVINNAIYYVKSKKWEYEKEYRMIGKPGLQKSPFILESIYFGLRCKESVKLSIMSALAKRESTVQFYQMTEVKGTFDLEPEPITLSNVSGLPLSYVK